MSFKPYEVLYVDPPWRFRVWGRDTGHDRSAESHYKTMDAAELKAIPIKSLAAPDAWLFMWTTNPHLPEALALGAAWGFTYKTVAFTWVKLTVRGKFHVGMGYYTRANPELCLLFTSGSPKRKSAAVQELIPGDGSGDPLLNYGLFDLPLVARVGQHNKKPAAAYERIEALTGPETRKVELFARRCRAGWTAMGNEIDGLDITDAINQLAEK